jgi:SM-20-related protein
MSGRPDPGPLMPLPPWGQFTDVLPEADRALVLDWTLANRARFAASAVRFEGEFRIDPKARVSERLGELGPARAILCARLDQMLPELLAASGSRPFIPDYVELELAAHGDGAFFRRHSDLPFGAARAAVGGEGKGGDRFDRLVSAVYYFHREPKGFSGGALRLHRFGGDGGGPEDCVDIEPVQNSLVVFPSWALHEVRPVSCPSCRFEDYRFAINIWLCRASG